MKVKEHIYPTSYVNNHKKVKDETNSDKDSDEHVSDNKGIHRQIDISLCKFIYLLLESEILESDEVQNKPLPKTETTISAKVTEYVYYSCR